MAINPVQYGVKAIKAYMQCFAMIAQNKLFKMAALYRIDKFKHFFIFFFSYLKGRLIILIWIRVNFVANR